ncbi:hypothetical protein QYM36_011685 [Artemia franciscana]|uniref:NodB homology domain-containing protein n=2 Tax=Artemia franciscana TaxID=6661 RepID=A0AA88HMM9_ARTSF|nr:hypothetical protein QYM36_011685 [Artemia franciscana]
MILITFDDAINELNIKSYRKVFANRTNPNGCPIGGTFFVAHEYTNYQMVQQLHSEGHEIGVYSVSHSSRLEDAGYNEWVNEAVGMREMLRRWADVEKDDILGMRAPHLKPGRNAQYEVLTDYGFAWDSSLSTPPLKVPVWPYTLDHAIPHECRSGTCPTRAFPGVWEIPLNSHYVENFDGGYCPYLDQCVLHNMDADEVFDWLQEDFARYYDGNRAPYVMAFHTSWFQQKRLEQGLTKFLDWATRQDDIWFVTTTQSLLWLTEPTPINNLGSFQAWDCTKRDLPSKPCNLPKSCGLPFKNGKISDTRYMATCFTCPKQYPWLGDTAGSGSETPDVYEPETPK